MEPDPSVLPFLVAYGGWVWKGIVVAAAVAAVVAYRRGRARRARRAGTAAVAAVRAQGSGALADGPAVVEGRLRADAPRDGVAAGTLEVAPGASVGPPSVTVTGGALWLDVGGERIALDGEIVVRAGTRAASSWWWVSRAVPRHLVAAARERGLVGDGRRIPRGHRGAAATWIDDGAMVVVDGVLARAPDGGAGGYREDAGRWVVRAGDGPIAVSAVAAAVPPPPTSPSVPVARAMIAGGSALLALLLVGRVATGAMKRQDWRARPPGSFDAVAIAAATPNGRDDALRILHVRLGERRNDDASVRRWLAAAYLDEGCRGALDVLRKVQRLEDRVRLARRCGARQDELDALVLLGHFDEAAARMAGGQEVPARLEGRIAITTGDWARAAAAADWDAAYRPPDRANLRRCLSDLFRARAGDVDAVARIEARLQEEGAHGCRLVLAMARSGAPRLELLAAGFDDISLAWVASKLRWAEGQIAASGIDRYGPVRALLGDVGSAEETWLARDAHASLAGPTGGSELIGVHGWRAYAALVRGDEAALRGALDDLDAAAAGDAYHEDDALLIRAAVAQRTAEDVVAPSAERRGWVPELTWRAGTPPPPLFSYGSGCEQRAAAAAAGLAAGDGRPLADLLRRCEVPWDPASVLATLPRLGEGRDEVAGALRWWTDEYAERRSWPFAWVEYAALRRDLFRLAGDPEEAARWDGIVQRYLPLLDDPERVRLLLLWNL